MFTTKLNSETILYYATILVAAKFHFSDSLIQETIK